MADALYELVLESFEADFPAIFKGYYSRFESEIEALLKGIRLVSIYTPILYFCDQICTNTVAPNGRGGDNDLDDT